MVQHDELREAHAFGKLPLYRRFVQLGDNTDLGEEIEQFLDPSIGD
jgi:hypothetical protein